MLEVANIHKSYESQPLLRGVSFSVAADETVCLLGPSGSGKSTLLRIIAGLETAERGELYWDGQDLSSIPVHLRNFGLVFQDYALFPHLSIAENVAFGLKMQHMRHDDIVLRVTETLAKVNLSGLEKRRVTELSGGEQQRVALARALAPRPRLLMLDEPLGALDRSLRELLIDELREILHTTNIPAIYVTHDQEEAFAIADVIMLLHDGKIVRRGIPQEVWNEPGSSWAARFLGLGNLVEGQVQSNGFVKTGLGTFRPSCLHHHRKGEYVKLLLRPEGVHIVDKEATNTVTGLVTDVTFNRHDFKVKLSNEFYCFLSRSVRIGHKIILHWPDERVQCLDSIESESSI